MGYICPSAQTAKLLVKKKTVDAVSESAGYRQAPTLRPRASGPSSETAPNVAYPTHRQSSYIDRPARPGRSIDVRALAVGRICNVRRCLAAWSACPRPQCRRLAISGALAYRIDGLFLDE